MMHHCRGRFAVLLYVYVCGRLIISILAMETHAARWPVASGRGQEERRREDGDDDGRAARVTYVLRARSGNGLVCCWAGSCPGGRQDLEMGRGWMAGQRLRLRAWTRREDGSWLLDPGRRARRRTSGRAPGGSFTCSAWHVSGRSSAEGRRPRPDGARCGLGPSLDSRRATCDAGTGSATSTTAAVSVRPARPSVCPGRARASSRAAPRKTGSTRTYANPSRGASWPVALAAGLPRPPQSSRTHQRGGRPRASETTQRVAQPPPASLGLPPPTLPTSAPGRPSRGLDTLRAASAASSGISDSSASGPPAWVRVAEANVALQITMTAINLHVLA